MTEEEFDELRPSAFAIAYRMLGSVSEAEDVVQEGFLRLHRARAGGERIESPRAYLSTVVSRLSLDQLRSARVRRETYVGEWLPEPLVTSADDDPARKAEIADSLSLAFLVVLESLSPEQRAAFLLREVFDEPYDRIAEIVGTSEQNARQLATRARRHLEGRRPRFEAQDAIELADVPERKPRRNVPSVEGAITRCPSTSAVRPARNTSQSSMQSAPSAIPEISVITFAPSMPAPTRAPRSTRSSTSDSIPSRPASVADKTTPASATAR